VIKKKTLGLPPESLRKLKKGPGLNLRLKGLGNCIGGIKDFQQNVHEEGGTLSGPLGQRTDSRGRKECSPDAKKNQKRIKEEKRNGISHGGSGSGGEKVEGPEEWGGK